MRAESRSLASFSNLGQACARHSRLILDAQYVRRRYSWFMHSFLLRNPCGETSATINGSLKADLWILAILCLELGFILKRQTTTNHSGFKGIKGEVSCRLWRFFGPVSVTDWRNQVGITALGKLIISQLPHLRKSPDCPPWLRLRRMCSSPAPVPSG